jgi:AraC-like DNA-binding protein
MPIPNGYKEVLHSARGRSAIEAAWTSFTEKARDHRVLPDGRCDIILRFHSDGSKPLGIIFPAIAGAATRFHIVQEEPGTGCVGVRLRPGTASKVLGVTLKEITEQGIGGNAAIAKIPALAALCAPAKSIDELVNRLDEFVIGRSSEAEIDSLTSGLIDMLHMTGGRLPVTEIASLHGVDVRMIHRRIVKATGLTPKQMAMVIQFHRALRLIIDGKLDIASAAFEAGYSDQAHMTRVFQTMGGFSPARLPELVLAGLPI